MVTYIPDYNGTFGLFSVANTLEETEKILSLGLRAVLIEDDHYRTFPDNYCFKINKTLSDLTYRDVIEIDNKGILRCVYKYNSNSNALVTGMSCNCNCVMCPCSEQSRKNKNMLPINYLKNFIDYIPNDAPHLTVTGGEPTLLRNDFFELVNHLNNKLPNTYILYLTNGRAFVNDDYAARFITLLNNRNRVAIPIHGCNALIHDSITQTPGSFNQTIKGIKNLEKSLAEIELRIVISKINYTYLTAIAELIIQTFRRITTVNFIGIEMLGNAIKNKNRVWIGYDKIFSELQPAIDKLIKAEFDVKIYNFPLCVIKREYWNLCEKSISDYKVVYKEICCDCSVKTLCGGFFKSTNKYIDTPIAPVRNI